MTEIKAIDIEKDATDFADLGFATQDALDTFIREGLDSVEQHGTIPHAVVMARMRATIAKHRV